MGTADIIIIVVFVSYIIYRTLTPKKGDETSTPVGRFFGAVFKSLLALIILAVLVYFAQLFFVGAAINSYFGLLSAFIK